MGNNKDFKKFESFLVCIIITILMVLAGIYTDIPKKYCKLRSNGMPVPLLRNGYSIFNGTKYR